MSASLFMMGRESGVSPPMLYELTLWIVSPYVDFRRMAWHVPFHMPSAKCKEDKSVSYCNSPKSAARLLARLQPSCFTDVHRVSSPHSYTYIHTYIHTYISPGIFRLRARFCSRPSSPSSCGWGKERRVGSLGSGRRPLSPFDFSRCSCTGAVRKNKQGLLHCIEHVELFSGPYIPYLTVRPCDSGESYVPSGNFSEDAY
jgi:hypothetical protein